MKTKKQKIKEFLESDRTDYVTFLNNLEGEDRPDVNTKMENNKRKKEFLEDFEKPDYEHEFMDNGVYGRLVGQPPYQELDFEKFSFTALKELSEDEDLKETVDIISEMPETHKRKRLRIRLFDRLKDINSPYFDEPLYHEMVDTMLEARKVAENVIADRYTILTKGFDSFSFLAPPEQAEKLREEVNKELEFGKMSLETKKNAVKFYNIAYFQDLEGEWYIRRSTGTDYDSYKEDVVKALSDLDFEKATKVIVKGKNEEGTNDDKFKEYMSVLNDMKQDHRERKSKKDFSTAKDYV